MQRDYFSQMQSNQTGTPTPNEVSTGPGAPGSMGAASQQQPPLPALTPQEEMNLQETEENLSKPEQKQRILELLEEAGIMESASEEEKKEVMKQIDNALEALEKGDVQAFQNNPVIQLVGSLVGGAAEMTQMNEGQGPSEQQMMQMEQEAETADQQMAPDMASMAGMTGGNL